MTVSKHTALLTAFFGATALSSMALAATTAVTTSTTATLDANATKKVVSNLQDGTLVTASGTVGAFSDGDEFTLNIGGSTIKVDTNDDATNLFGDNREARNVLKPGDKVTVTGTIDENLFDRKEIDATVVQFNGKNYYSALTPAAGGTVAATTTSTNPVYADWEKEYEVVRPYDTKEFVNDRVRLTGNVVKISDADTFTLDYNGGTIEVDINDNAFMKKNSKIAIGDRVALYGEMDDNWFTKRHFEADTLVRLGG